MHGEIRYGRGSKFIDWWIEKEDKVYLFESKAYQFALLSKQTGDPELIDTNEIRKIAEAIEQVYKRIQDIPKFEELKIFRKKKQRIPVIVFMDMPFISDNFYDPWIKKHLMKMEQEKQLPGLKDFPVSLMNIRELELYDGAVDAIELENVFSKHRKNIGGSFEKIVEKAKGKVLRNHYLDQVFKDFWNVDFGTGSEKQ